MHPFQPRSAVERCFEAISRIPRASGEEKAVSDYILARARSLGLEAWQDSLFNVVVRKSASPGYEAAAPVMLQAHLDMVCVKAPGSRHDFSSDPLELLVDDAGRLRAKDTTLGADDGYGVAYMLAIMEDTGGGQGHPELELVFTSQEENGCYGAQALDMSRIRARRMIGLDVMESTEESVCCVSCFCSDRLILRREVTLASCTWEALELTVEGIQPIREGACVHPELYNAIKLTARLLGEMRSAGYAFRLVSMQGGEAENYNPVSCRTVLCAEKPDAFVREAGRRMKLAAEEIQDGRQSTAVRAGRAEAGEALDRASTDAVLDALVLLPSNTLTMDQRTQEMTSICCVGTVSLASGVLEVVMSDRARSDSYRAAVEDRVRVIARLTGCRAEVSERYAPWPYRRDSDMLRRTAALMRSFYGKDMTETVCPGGLEACDFLKKVPDLDIVMFAPVGEKCHSTEEYLDLASFERVYRFLRLLLSGIRE